VYFGEKVAIKRKRRFYFADVCGNLSIARNLRRLRWSFAIDSHERNDRKTVGECLSVCYISPYALLLALSFILATESPSTLEKVYRGRMDSLH